MIARAGLASRREAEDWIAAGRVAVNGEVIRSAALNVTDRDSISVDGEPLPERERTRLFLYHKPRGLLTTHADPQGRPTIFAKLSRSLPRLISVGRLDFNTEGLLLLTNDGELARVLELPATGWLRRYRVRAHGTITQDKLDALHSGITISGIHYGAIEAAIDRVQGANLWLTFAIREGKNREVRTVLAHLGLEVTRLIRVSFGPFQLGELEEGEVEEVRTRVLREQLGEKLIAMAELDFSGAVVRREEADAQEKGRERRERSRVRAAITGSRRGRKSRTKKRTPHGRNKNAGPKARSTPGARTTTSSQGKNCAVSFAARALTNRGRSRPARCAPARSPTAKAGALLSSAMASRRHASNRARNSASVRALASAKIEAKTNARTNGSVSVRTSHPAAAAHRIVRAARVRIGLKVKNLSGA